MKKVLVVLMLLMLAVGCQSSDDLDDPTKAEKIPGDFNVDITGISDPPRWFTPVSWLSDNKIFGQAGYNSIIWHTDTKEQKLLKEPTWSSTISPDGKYLAYTNEQGLAVINLESGEEIWPQSLEGEKEQLLNPVPKLWSPDGSKLMYSYDFEWTSDLYIYDIAAGTVKEYRLKKEDSSLVSPVRWLSDEEILFVVGSVTSKTGEQEYTEAGYRNNLKVADLDGNSKAYTDTEDFTYVWPVGVSADNEKVAYILYHVHNGMKELHLLSLKDGNDETLLKDGDLMFATLTADGQYLVYVSQEQPEGTGQLYAMQSHSKKVKPVLDIKYHFDVVEMLSNNRGDQVYVTIKEAGRDYNHKLLTITH
ncbi:TolB family protein [Desulfofalx alkaliphila]|uniref:TolB family protein n=1 Tax=Desulfofalx alkaliphila TaxID=105483 RepID=UPI0004E19C30|nr:PD40 domain-containing protein [Desulfofalx alkaliphila]